MNTTANINVTNTLLGLFVNDGVPPDVRCAALVAVAHANARNGSVVPAFASLSPARRWSGLFFDDRSSPPVGVSRFVLAEKLNVQAIVGPALTLVAEPVALLSGITRIPHVSYQASAPTLSDKSLYPYFARTFASDATLAEQLVWALLGGFFPGWHNIFILQVNNPWANAYASAMQTAALNVSYNGYGSGIYRAFFESGSRLSIKTAVQQLATSEASVIVLLVSSAEDMWDVLELADEAGLITPKHAWIGIELHLKINFLAMQARPDRAKLLEGFLSFSWMPRDSSRLKTLWPTLATDPAARACRWRREHVGEVDFGSPPFPLADLIYDAVAALALAFDAADRIADFGGRSSLQERTRARANSEIRRKGSEPAHARAAYTR